MISWANTSGAVVSWTVIVTSTDEEFPEPSVPVKVTILSPISSQV